MNGQQNGVEVERGERTTDIEREIRDLEQKLAIAKSRLKTSSNGDDERQQQQQQEHSLKLRKVSFGEQNDLHMWLLLADSALPIGSFAFSSGLESYILHRNLSARSCSGNSSNNNNKLNPRTELYRFLALTLRSTASTAIPYVRDAFINPANAFVLDDQFDASTTCNVARRASVSQGKALLTVWEKSLCNATTTSSDKNNRDVVVSKDVRNVVDSYVTAVRVNDRMAHGHYGVAWGAVCRAAGLAPLRRMPSSSPLSSTMEVEAEGGLEDHHGNANDEAVDHVLFVFLFNHVKAILSAAVRQSLIGPYGAQAVLASPKLKKMLRRAVDVGKRIKVEDAGQTVPTIDMYQGRHDILYSRVFNS